MQFIMNYPLDGKKLNYYLDFYVTNLKYVYKINICCCLHYCCFVSCTATLLLCSYEEQSGRESVIELLAAIFNKFPEVCVTLP